MDEDRKRFGQKIRSTREAAHFSRDAVAEKAGIGVNYLGQIERGEKWPTLEVIVSLADAIGVSASVFLEPTQTETEPEALKTAINQLLQNRDAAQLQIAFRILKALLVG